jgi:hypothetical protein
MWILLGLIALAVLGPLFGTDTRDGLDWAPGDFWRRPRPRPRRVRSSGSREREDADRAAAVRCRPVPAAW